MSNNLLEDNSWSGTFHPPERDDLSFGGKLTFSPTEGMKFHCAFPLGSEMEGKWSHLHGYTTEGEALTIIGNLDFTSLGFKFKNGLSFRTTNNHPVNLAIIGHHFSPDTKFSKISFKVHQSEEFFSDKQRLDLTKEIDRDVFSITSESKQLTASYTAKLNYIPDDITRIIHSNDTEALMELQKAYENIKSRNPKFTAWSKNNIGIEYTLSSTSDVTINDGLEASNSIANLFSILFFAPCKTSSLYGTIYEEIDGKKSRYDFQIFPHTVSDKDSLEYSKKEKKHHSMPLSAIEIDIEKILPQWMKLSRKFSTIISSAQSETGLISTHQILSDIVLNVAQLEAMAKENGINSNSAKFQYAIDHHSSDKVKNILCNIFEKNTSELGRAIGEFRNEITHMGRPKIYSEKLGFQAKFRIYRCLHAIVAGYALACCNAPKEAIHKYQNKLLW